MSQLPDSAVRLIVRSRFFRSAFLALFLGGIGISATNPQLTLFLVRDLGAPLPVAGLFYMTNLAALVAGYLVGRLSDRGQDRLLPFRACVLVGTLGWLSMSAATALWQPFVISTVALSISGASMAQLFAASWDELSRHPTSADNRVMALIRMAFTGGWVVGPVLGSWFGSVFGLRPLMIATASCILAQLIPLGRQRVARHSNPVVANGQDGPGRLSRMLPLIAFTGACVLAMTGDTIKFGYLPIYMAEQLRISDGERGAVIAVQPLLEFALLPLAARLADRFGPLRIMAVGAAMGVGANVAYATSGSVSGLFLGQALTAGLWACVGALGVSIAQRLYPEAVATASGIFLSSISLSAAIGGAIGGLGVAALGLPGVFVVPAGLTAVATAGLLVLARRLRVRAPAMTAGVASIRNDSDLQASAECVA